MIKPKRCTAIKTLVLMALLGSVSWVQAAPVAGTVLHLSGPLFVKKADGSLRALGAQSAVEVGDTLSTQGTGYAQIRFSDDSLLTLQPNTALAIDRYAFDAAVPAADAMQMTLRQGGVRTQPGKLGLRSKPAATLVTPVARIGLESATAVVQYVPAATASSGLALLATDLEASALQSDSLLPAMLHAVAARYAYRLASVAAHVESWAGKNLSPIAVTFSPSSPAAGGPMGSAQTPGLYVAVLDGQISVKNTAGTSSFTAGQFGFTPQVTQPPVMIPKNPGIQFTPPAIFNSTTTTANTSSPVKANAVDCTVR